jgi:dipeptidase
MCDTMVLVEPGRVLFAKNSDRDPNEAQVLDWHPAADHPPGGMLRCTWMEIPQAAHTHAVVLSRPFWVWGAEMGTNEHGVVIGNEAVFTDQPYADVGLTGMDLLRLALERSTSASDAVTTITHLLAAHGQGGGCGHEDRSFTYHNSFIVADHGQAFVLETAGTKWAVEEVANGARSISNGLTIQGFAEDHADRLRGRVAQCAARRRITERAAAAATGVHDLMEILRTHADGAIGPSYAIANGAMSAPCMHAGGLLTASQTTASWVAELTTDAAHHWATATAAPCTSVFKPVSVTEPVDLGPAPTDRYDRDTLWWRHERLHRAVIRDPERLLPTLVGDRDDLERSWTNHRPGTAEAFAAANDLEQAWTQRTAGSHGADRRPWLVRRYWRTRDLRAGLTG